MANIAKLVVCILIGVSLSMTACKESAPTEGKKKQSEDNAEPEPFTPTETEPEPEPCKEEDHDEDEDEDEELDDDNGFNLVGTPKSPGFKLADEVTWDDDIKSIIDNNCVSCHGAGGTDPELTSYSKVKSAKSGVERTVLEKETMPKSGPLGSSDQKKIQGWLESGLLESASDSEGDDERDDEDHDGDRSDPCDSGLSDDDDDDDDFSASDWNDLLEPKKLKECKSDGKIYDRAKDECHKAKTDIDFSCDWSGIKKAFDGVSIDSEMTKIQNDGFEVDQCGQYNGDPIIYFIKKTNPDNAMGLKIRKICKTGSEVCN